MEKDYLDIEKIINEINIVDYIGQYADLEERGTEYWCCSPLNENDTEPSFSISEDKQRFYDFSTGKYGDIINFVRYYHKCSFDEAISKILIYLGLEDSEFVSYRKSPIYEYFKKYNKKIRKLKEINYNKIPENFLDRYLYSEDKLKTWIDEGIPIDLIKKYKIRYDGSNNSIAIPMYDNEGNIVNISKRTLDLNYKQNKIAKYKPAFKWNGGIDILWGYYFNKESIKNLNKIILVEGVKSVLKLEKYGYNNSVAILTSKLNFHQMKFLLSLKLEEYIFALDKGIDIKEDKHISILNNFVNISYIRDYKGLINDKDSPCDKGKSVFDKLYDSRIKLK